VEKENFNQPIRKSYFRKRGSTIFLYLDTNIPQN